MGHPQSSETNLAGTALFSITFEAFATSLIDIVNDGFFTSQFNDTMVTIPHAVTPGNITVTGTPWRVDSR